MWIHYLFSIAAVLEFDGHRKIIEDPNMFFIMWTIFTILEIKTEKILKHKNIQMILFSISWKLRSVLFLYEQSPMQSHTVLAPWVAHGHQEQPTGYNDAQRMACALEDWLGHGQNVTLAHKSQQMAIARDWWPPSFLQGSGLPEKYKLHRAYLYFKLILFTWNSNLWFFG